MLHFLLNAAEVDRRRMLGSSRHLCVCCALIWFGASWAEMSARAAGRWCATGLRRVTGTAAMPGERPDV